MQTIAVSGLKGGTGKTAVARNLGAELAAMGKRVLLVDADPQAGLTRACGVRDASGQSMAEVIGTTEPGTLGIGDVIREASPGLWLAPSDLALSRSELGLVLRPARELVLARALATVAADFDVCVIDCAPAVSLLVVNALCASDGVLSPVLAEMQSLHALRLFWAEPTRPAAVLADPRHGAQRSGTRAAGDRHCAEHG
jgi:chromosome partitioning protein